MEGFDKQLLDRLRDALGDDTFEELVRDFVADLPRLSKAIAKAHAEGDVEALQEAAHELKGVAVLFGATDLARSCTDLIRLDERSETAADMRVKATLLFCEAARLIMSRSPVRSAC